MDRFPTKSFKSLLLLWPLTGLAAGLVFSCGGWPEQARALWLAGVAPVLAGLIVEIVRSLARKDVERDIVAALSMSAAMYSGGTFLEGFAEARARREMRDLLVRVPRTATRHRDGGLEEVALDATAPGDRLLIRQGDVVPVDGRIASAQAFLDTAALTGKSLPSAILARCRAPSSKRPLTWPSSSTPCERSVLIPRNSLDLEELAGASACTGRDALNQPER